MVGDRQSQVPCLSCTRMLSDAVSDLCATRIRCRHEVTGSEKDGFVEAAADLW